MTQTPPPADFLARLIELAGADVAAKLQAELGGQMIYIPRPLIAAPDKKAA